MGRRPERLVAGVDVGNQTTEIALALSEEGRSSRFVAASLAPTTGIKGTVANVAGVRAALDAACRQAGCAVAQIALIRINEAAPVVSGVAMQAITETTLTDSALVGHNPDTPGGEGLGVGTTALVTSLRHHPGPVVAVIPGSVPFEQAARLIAEARADGVEVAGAIVQSDDAVLIANRIGRPPVPIVDEVAAIDAVPLGQPAAVEVAPPGGTIQTLCNPYGLATIFGLDPETTARLAPAARALTGLRSAVVVRTPAVAVVERRIEAGSLTLVGERGEGRIDVRAGADEIMKARFALRALRDVRGDPGTTVGAMIGRLKAEMTDATGRALAEIAVTDLLAVDLQAPQPVVGGLSHEVAPERAVALAAMVVAGTDQSRDLAAALAAELGVPVEPGGSEADAGIRGASTSPGTGLPLAVLDLGSGSTNAARIDRDGRIAAVHLAGGGAMVNLLIGEELGIADESWREEIKRYRVARAEGLFALRHEDGLLQFLAEPLPVHVIGRTVLLRDGEPDPIPGNPPLARLVDVRRRAKQRVFGANALRGLGALAPGGNLRYLGFVALVGGSALDFELPGLLAAQLAEFGIVTGAANVQGRLGPRNAVATGLALGIAPCP